MNQRKTVRLQLSLVALTALCLVGLTGPSRAQRLYGVEGPTTTLWEFTTATGPPCPQPNLVVVPCTYGSSGTCGIVPPAQFAGPPLGLFGDVATNPLTDTVWVTDGLALQEYVGDAPCGSPPPCTPINSLSLPASLGLSGPITGLGMDALGTLTSGVPTLWITDGTVIAGLAVGSCAPAFVIPGCTAPIPPGRLLTDLSWDTGTYGPGLWACDDSGFVYFISMPGCSLVTTFSPANCGLGVPLTGIAYDAATPNTITGQGDALYVTDGFHVEYVDLSTLGPASSFYTPIACTPAPAPLSGLAYAAHANTYGKPRVSLSVGSFGQSSTPGPTFGVEVTGAPAGDNIWMIVNFNAFGTGYLCPPLSGAGTLFWVDPTPPAIILNLGPFPSGCVPLPIPIPSSVPIGLQLFFQFLALPPSGPRATDATGGLALTVTVP